MVVEPKQMALFKESGLPEKCVAGWKGIADGRQDSFVHKRDILYDQILQ